MGENMADPRNLSNMLNAPGQEEAERLVNAARSKYGEQFPPLSYTLAAEYLQKPSMIEKMNRRIIAQSERDQEEKKFIAALNKDPKFAKLDRLMAQQDLGNTRRETREVYANTSQFMLGASVPLDEPGLKPFLASDAKVKNIEMEMDEVFRKSLSDKGISTKNNEEFIREATDLLNEMASDPALKEYIKSAPDKAAEKPSVDASSAIPEHVKGLADKSKSSTEPSSFSNLSLMNFAKNNGVQIG